MAHTAAVLGASGYSGGELVRLLSGHPALSVIAAAAGANAGRALADVHPHLAATGLELTDISSALAVDADVCFSCLPPGALHDRLAEVRCGVLVDLSADHRTADGWVYGLTEFQRDAVRGAGRIANPGCYPTAALLCLLPFARAGLLSEVVVIDAMSGVSGAGRKTEDRLLYGSLEGNLTAYGSGIHRHVPEMDASIYKQLAVNAPVPVPFAAKMLAEMGERGFSEEQRLRYLAILYQLRRAFYFIVDALIGDSVRKQIFLDGAGLHRSARRARALGDHARSGH